MAVSFKKITTAVFPVAGMGTRFLPVTKSSPKEMLPIVDKPLIHYVVEEAVEAGINQLVFITSYNKRCVEDYFDSNFELEQRLSEKGNNELLSSIRNIVPKNVNIVYLRQHAPLGLGHAVLCAKKVIGNNPFAVLLADDIIDCEGTSCLKEMVTFYEKTRANVLAVEEVALSDTKNYGIVSFKQNAIIPNQIEHIVEKPDVEKAPSNFAVIGRYILTARIFELLENTDRGRGGEIQLTDAIEKLIQEQPVAAFLFDGHRYDCGSKLGFLEATINYALKRPDLSHAFINIMREKINHFSLS